MKLNNPPTVNNSHAIVIGGSIAGLLAARALADFFANITVIERDTLPESPTFRKGAPHAKHGHILLARGQQIMEHLFPGYTEMLIQHGAVKLNMGRDVAFALRGVRMSPYNSALDTLACSRALMEYGLYSQLLNDKQIEFRQGCAVEAIMTDAARTRTTGVYLRPHGRTNAPVESLSADLVVDASGRGSKLPKWLAQNGYSPPNEITVDAQVGYTSRLYRRTSFGPNWKSLYAMPDAPNQPRGGAIFPIEGEKVEGGEADSSRWLVTLIGLNGDHPPTDEQGFLNFARSLPVADIYNMLRDAEPIGKPFGYRRAANRLRQYDKLPRYLDGLLALGDSVYALNPVYGQGMTLAALGAQTLQTVLTARQQRDGHLRDLQGLARTYQHKLARVIDGPWQMATGQDMLWPEVAKDHQPSRMTRLTQRYIDAVLTTMMEDKAVAEAFFGVQNMLTSPTALFHPAILYRVWRAQKGTSSTTINWQEASLSGTS